MQIPRQVLQSQALAIQTLAQAAMMSKVTAGEPHPAVEQSPPAVAGSTTTAAMTAAAVLS